MTVDISSCRPVESTFADEESTLLVLRLSATRHCPNTDTVHLHTSHHDDNHAVRVNRSIICWIYTAYHSVRGYVERKHTHCKNYPYIHGYFVASFPYFNGTGSVKVPRKLATKCPRIYGYFLTVYIVTNYRSVQTLKRVSVRCVRASSRLSREVPWCGRCHEWSS